MQIPTELREKVRELSQTVSVTELRRAALRLSEAYRSDGTPGPLLSGAERLAYLTVRLPATYAAVRSALMETAQALADFAPKSLVDLGSGPGTAMWAATETFPSLSELEAVERDRALRSLGTQLAGASHSEVLRSATWKGTDLRDWRPARTYDLVVASYSLGELSPKDRQAELKRAWDACSGVLVVIEPGTRKGFENIWEVRRHMIDAGAELAAPCPGKMECPMKLAGDWCHFSVRLERTAEHRKLKQAELGYEDEKFSYVAGSRTSVRSAESRIVRHPLRYSGFTKLRLCTPAGLKERTVTRSQKDLYRKAKKVEWGSAWNESYDRLLP